MIDRRRYMGLTALPYDYEVEYLEGTGTQWIDTGIYPQGYIPTTIIEYQITLLNVSALYSGFTPYAREREFIIQNRSNFYWLPANTIYYRDLKIGVNYKVIIEPSKLSLYEDNIPVIDDISISHADFNKSISIFSGSGYTTIGKLYSIQIKRDDTFLFNAIPVVKDNVGYMYDKVSGQLFGNAGTGSFILGPDVN